MLANLLFKLLNLRYKHKLCLRHQVFLSRVARLLWDSFLEALPFLSLGGRLLPRIEIAGPNCAGFLLPAALGRLMFFNRRTLTLLAVLVSPNGRPHRDRNRTSFIIR